MTDFFPITGKNRKFDYENNFWMTCSPQRLEKCIAHYHLYEMIKNVEGAIIECGVFKGISLRRFIMMREIFDAEKERPVFGFDIFGDFPETGFEDDKKHLEHFINTAGLTGITDVGFMNSLEEYNLGQNVKTVKGDIVETVPEFCSRNPDLKIAMLHIDTDVYEPAKVILEHMYPRLVPGGVLVLDDYNIFPGETKAVDEYFAGKNVSILKFPFAATPYYIIRLPE